MGRSPARLQAACSIKRSPVAIWLIIIIILIIITAGRYLGIHTWFLLGARHSSQHLIWVCSHASDKK